MKDSIDTHIALWIGGLLISSLLAMVTGWWLQFNNRVKNLEANKVDCAICDQKERRGESRLESVNAKFEVMSQHITTIEEINREDHKELKAGVNTLAEGYGKFSADTQVSISKLSGCIDKLSGEIQKLNKCS